MTFETNTYETTCVTLRKGDPSFQLSDKFTLTNRASIEISSSCPEHIARMLRDAMFNGWIKPVAHVPKTDPTLMWDLLRSGEKL